MLFTGREIWEAGKKALGLSDVRDFPPPVAAPAPVSLEAHYTEAHPEVFNPETFGFQPRTYRIHFKNGCSGEYNGAALAVQFPFDPKEVADVRPVEDVGF